MHHNLIIKDGDATKVEKEILVDGVQFVDSEPREGSFNPVMSDGVAKAIELASDCITKLIPEGTSEQNKLVNESELKEVTAVIPEGTTSEDPLVNKTELEKSSSELLSRIIGNQPSKNTGFLTQSGGAESNSDFRYSGFLTIDRNYDIVIYKIEANTTGNLAPVQFFDSSNTFISWMNVGSLGYVHGDYTIIPSSAIPSNAYKVRVTYKKLNFDDSYIANPVSLDSLTKRVSIDESNILANISGIAENASRITLDESGAAVIQNGFIGQVRGYPYDSGAGFKCTDFIRLNTECDIIAEYVRTNTGGGVAPIAFYDQGKNYLGWLDVGSLGYVSGNRTKVPVSAFPVGSVYFRITIEQSYLSSFRVENPISLQRLMNNLDSIVSQKSPSVWMPEKVFALDGTTLQIFKGGIALVKNPDNYDLHIVNPSSSHCGYNRDWCYEYEVDDANSDFVLQFGVTNETMEDPAMCGETQIVHVSKKSSPASNKNILCIGDSFTDAGYWISEFKRLLTGVATESLSDTSDSDITADSLTNLTFIGTQDTTTTPNEGISGKDYDFFASSGSGGVTNPFWNPSTSDVDFNYYCTQNGFSGIDYAVILLGTNMAHSQASVFKVWDKLLAHNPNVKVLVLGRCFASPYGSGANGIQTNQEFLSLSSSAQQWNSTLQNYCKRDEYKNNFCFLDYNTQMDTFSNFRFSMLPCNIRNSEVTRRGSTNIYDNVHPWVKAYWQIADVVRAGFHYWCLE